MTWDRTSREFLEEYGVYGPVHVAGTYSAPVMAVRPRGEASTPAEEPMS